MTEQGGSNSGSGPLTEGSMKGVTKALKAGPSTSRPHPSTSRPPPPIGQAAGSGAQTPGYSVGPNSIPSTMLLSTTTGEMVHIRFVEAINFSQNEAEEIVGKLANDQIIKIRTISGKEHDVSVREMVKLDKGERTVEQMIAAIRGCFQRQES